MNSCALRPLPPPSPESFSLDGARATALVIHGFSGTPYELRVVAETLAAHGVGVRAPLLDGHGTRPSDLDHVGLDDWLATVRSAYGRLPADRPRIIVGGSMGGLLAILLAADEDTAPDALVLLAPALVLRPTGRVGAVLARAGISRVVPATKKAEVGGDCGAEDGRRANPTYPVMPFDGIAAFDRTRRAARAVIDRVRAPLCVVHGVGDRTVDPEASLLVSAQVQSDVVERHLLPHSRHLLGLDVDRDRIGQIIMRFLDAHLFSPAGPA